jgi:hypothetical protein
MSEQRARILERIKELHPDTNGGVSPDARLLRKLLKSLRKPLCEACGKELPKHGQRFHRGQCSSAGKPRLSARKPVEALIQRANALRQRVSLTPIACVVIAVLLVGCAAPVERKPVVELPPMPPTTKALLVVAPPIPQSRVTNRVEWIYPANVEAYWWLQHRTPNTEWRDVPAYWLFNNEVQVKASAPYEEFRMIGMPR